MLNNINLAQCEAEDGINLPETSDHEVLSCCHFKEKLNKFKFWKEYSELPYLQIKINTQNQNAFSLFSC